ncbi:hypothetical protein EWM60_09490, partial [Candidatus Erwinia dacicola]|nr:hypothetical protein [Candidatus Erwinia dacicola]
MVSARHKPLRLVERLQSKLASLGLRSSTELLAQLLAEQEDVLALIVRQSNQYVDPIEDWADSSLKCNAKPPVLALQRPLKVAGTQG